MLFHAYSILNISKEKAVLIRSNEHVFISLEWAYLCYISLIFTDITISTMYTRINIKYIIK